MPQEMCLWVSPWKCPPFDRVIGGTNTNRRALPHALIRGPATAHRGRRRIDSPGDNRPLYPAWHPTQMPCRLFRSTNMRKSYVNRLKNRIRAWLAPSQGGGLLSSSLPLLLVLVLIISLTINMIIISISVSTITIFIIAPNGTNEHHSDEGAPDLCCYGNIVVFLFHLFIRPIPHINIVGFRGFDSSVILILRVGIPRPIGDFPESLSQAMLEGCNVSREIGRVCVIFVHTCSFLH